MVMYISMVQYKCLSSIRRASYDPLCSSWTIRYYFYINHGLLAALKRYIWNHTKHRRREQRRANAPETDRKRVNGISALHSS